MLFFVKSEVEPGKLAKLTRKVIAGEIQKVRGNIVYLSPDGRIGYDIVEATDEADVYRKYSPYGGYLRLVEVSPIVPAHEFYEQWERQHALAAAVRR
jgi:hypothetical protein